MTPDGHRHPRWGDGLIAISDRRQLPDEDVVDWARNLATTDVSTLWLREKDLADRPLFEIAYRLREVWKPPRRLLLSARPDLALAAGADGVHLPAEGLPVDRVRNRWPELIVGCSTHSLSEVQQARDQGADYVTFGPIFSTPSKAGLLEARGLAGLQEAATLGLPVFALGGVKLANLPEILATRAEGFAAIRFFLPGEGLSERVARAHELMSAAPQPNADRERSSRPVR